MTSRNGSFGHSHLTSEEARRIAAAIARIPEFLKQRKGFYARGPGIYRWSMARPFHVAFEDSYVRANWDGINAQCRFNSIPFDAIGEKIRREGLRCAYQFAQQLDAMMAWDRFKGRWMLGRSLISRAAGEHAGDERSQSSPAVE